MNEGPGVSERRHGPRVRGVAWFLGRRRVYPSVALVLLFVLAGCGGGAGGTAAPADDGGEAPADGDTGESVDFPTQDIRWIIPSSAGGGLDTTARQIAPHWEEELGVSIVVENHEGGNFAVGATLAARAEPDCHTILFHIDPILHLSYLTQDVDYTYEDFYPIGRATIEPSIFLVREESEWETLEDLVADAEARPGEITVGVGGLTSSHNIAFLQLEEATGADFNIVPYDGGGESRTALIAGEIDVAVGGVFNSQEIADETRTLAVIQPENEWPDLTDNAPTVREALGMPDYPSNAGDYGVFVPAECPEQYPERFQVLVDTFQAATSSEELHAQLEELGELEKLSVTSPEEFDQQMRESLDSVQQVIENNPELQGGQ